MAVNLLDRFENYKIFSLENRNNYFKSLRRKNFTVPNSAQKNGFTDVEFFDALKELIITHFDMDTNEIIRYKGGLDAMLDPMQRDLLWALYNQMDYMIGNGTWKLIDGNLSVQLGGNSIQTSSNSLSFNWHDDSWSILVNYKLVDQYGTGQLKWNWNNGWCQYDINDEIISTKKYVDEQVLLEENARKSTDIQLQNNIIQEQEERINGDSNLENKKLDKTDQFFRKYQATDSDGNPIGSVSDVGFVKTQIFQGINPLPYNPITQEETLNAINQVPVTGATVSPVPIKDNIDKAIAAGWAYTIDSATVGKEGRLNKVEQAIIAINNKLEQMLWEEVDTSDFTPNANFYELPYDPNYYYRIYTSAISTSTNERFGEVFIRHNINLGRGSLVHSNVYHTDRSTNGDLAIWISQGQIDKTKIRVSIYNGQQLPYEPIKSIYVERISKDGYVKQTSLKRIKREINNIIEENSVKENEIISYDVVKKMIENADDIYEMIQIEKHPLYKKELENKSDIKSIFNKKWLELSDNGK